MKLFIINKTGRKIEDISRYAARAIILKNDKLLMIKATTHNEEYKFPGGGMNENETPTECLIREVAEEVGRIVIPSSVKPYGYVIEERIDKNDKSKSFTMKSYYYLCEIEN